MGHGDYVTHSECRESEAGPRHGLAAKACAFNRQKPFGSISERDPQTVVQKIAVCEILPCSAELHPSIERSGNYNRYL